MRCDQPAHAPAIMPSSHGGLYPGTLSHSKPFPELLSPGILLQPQDKKLTETWGDGAVWEQSACPLC